MLMPLSSASSLPLGANLIVIEADGSSYEAIVLDLGKVTEPDEEEGGNITRTIMVVVESRPENPRTPQGAWQRRVLHANDDGVLDMWDIDDESDGGEDMRDVRTVLWRMN